MPAVWVEASTSIVAIFPSSSKVMVTMTSPSPYPAAVPRRVAPGCHTVAPFTAAITARELTLAPPMISISLSLIGRVFPINCCVKDSSEVLEPRPTVWVEASTSIVAMAPASSSVMYTVTG